MTELKKPNYDIGTTKNVQTLGLVSLKKWRPRGDRMTVLKCLSD